MKYDEIPAVRRSDLWELRKSPVHYLYKVTHPSEATPALTFGIMAHKYILENADFWSDYVLLPKLDRRTKEGKQLYAEIMDSGKIPVTPEDLEVLTEMKAAIDAHPTADAFLNAGAHEVPIEWNDPETGEPCKCRPDVLVNIDGVDWIVDYKTTTDCSGFSFERSCRTYGYKLQAAMYSDGVFNAMMLPCRFAFVAQEKNPPYAVRVYTCDQGFIDEGMELYRELIGLYHKCKTSGNWPGYEDKELIGDE